MLIKRILLSAVDAGGGAAPPAPAPPASTPQQPAAPAHGAAAPPVDIASIVRQTTDAVFADLRRAGLLSDKSRRGRSTPAAAAPIEDGETPAPTAPDHTAMRAFDRVLSRGGWATQLSELQYQHAERAFAHDSPPDVEAWARSYFAGWGSAPQQQPAAGGSSSTPPAASTPNPAPNVQRNTPPVSDGGSPPPPTVPLEQRQIESMSDADRKELLQRVGPKKFTEMLRSQRRGKVVLLRPA